MSRKPIRAVSLALVAAIGLGVAVPVSPGAPGLTVEIYLFVVAVLVLAGILLHILAVLPTADPAPFEPPPRTQRVGQLESIARALDLAEVSGFDLHHALRPIVREIAAAQLARRGVSLDRQPERAEAMLGAPTWELVRPDHEAPIRGSRGGGYSRDELRAIVGSLEAI